MSSRLGDPSVCALLYLFIKKSVNLRTKIREKQYIRGSRSGLPTTKWRCRSEFDAEEMILSMHVFILDSCKSEMSMCSLRREVQSTPSFSPRRLDHCTPSIDNDSSGSRSKGVGEGSLLFWPNSLVDGRSNRRSRIDGKSWKICICCSLVHRALQIINLRKDVEIGA